MVPGVALPMPAIWCSSFPSRYCTCQNGSPRLSLLTPAGLHTLCAAPFRLDAAAAGGLPPLPAGCSLPGRGLGTSPLPAHRPRDAAGTWLPVGGRMLITGGHPPAGLHRGQDTWKGAEPSGIRRPAAAPAPGRCPQPPGRGGRAPCPRCAAPASGGSGERGRRRGAAPGDPGPGPGALRGRHHRHKSPLAAGAGRAGRGSGAEPSRAAPSRAQSCRRCARRAPAVPGSRAAAGGPATSRYGEVCAPSVCPSVRPSVRGGCGRAV